MIDLFLFSNLFKPFIQVFFYVLIQHLAYNNIFLSYKGEIIVNEIMLFLFKLFKI